MTEPAYTPPATLEEILLPCDEIWASLAQRFAGGLRVLSADGSFADSAATPDCRPQEALDLGFLDRASRLLRRIQTARLQIFKHLHPASRNRSSSTPSPHTEHPLPETSAPRGMGVPHSTGVPRDTGASSGMGVSPMRHTRLSPANTELTPHADLPCAESAKGYSLGRQPQKTSPHQTQSAESATGDSPTRRAPLLPCLSPRATALPSHLQLPLSDSDIRIADEFNDLLTELIAVTPSHAQFTQSIEALKADLLRPIRETARGPQGVP